MTPTYRQTVYGYIEGYEQMVMQRVAEGCEPFLITFMFDDIPGSEGHVLSVMRNEVERWYSTLATRVVRNPRSLLHREKLPFMIAAPDWPVAKHERLPKRLIMPNNGAHMHGELLLNPLSRLGDSFPAHIKRKQGLYVRPPLSLIDVKPITHNAGGVLDYVLKSLKRGRITPDDIIILPRVLSELSGR